MLNNQEILKSRTRNTTPGRFSEKIDEDVPDEELSDTIRQGMKAMMETRSGKMVPDWRTRAIFAQMAAAYKIGKPVERKEANNSGQGRSLEDMIALAKKCPSFRATLVNMLESVLANS